MSLAFGTLSLPALLMAFGGGVFGAALGGLQCFVLLGLVGLGAMAVDANGVSFLLNVGFGFWLHPATFFSGNVIALSYAGKKGCCGGKDLLCPLLSLRKPSILVVAGCAGVVGYLLYYLAAVVLQLNADNGAVAVITASLLCKVVMNHTLFGKPDAETAQLSRFSTKHDNHWMVALHDGPSKLLVGFALSAVAAAATYAVGMAYGAEADSSVWAGHMPAFICFFISAASLMFLAGGYDMIVNHQTTLSAGYAFCCSAAAGATMEVAFLWAIAVGIAATFIADFVGDAFLLYGETHIDPPAFTHLIVSVVVFNLNQTILAGIAAPVLLLVVLAVLAVTVYRPAGTPALN